MPDRVTARALHWASLPAACLLVVLAVRPWLQPHDGTVLLTQAIIAAIWLPVGLLAAWALWRKSAMVQAGVAGGLIAAAVLSPSHGAGLGLVALPTLAALRRAAPALLDEAPVGGAGPMRIVIRPVLQLAAPGLLFGLLLAAQPPPVATWQVLAACAPLAVQRQRAVTGPMAPRPSG